MPSSSVDSHMKLLENQANYEGCVIALSCICKKSTLVEFLKIYGLITKTSLKLLQSRSWHGRYSCKYLGIPREG